MPVKTLCPSCHKKLSVPDHLAGKPIKCPGCGKSFLSTAQPVDVERLEAPPGTEARHGIALLPWLVAGLSIVLLLVVSILWLFSGSVTGARREAAVAQAELAKARAEAEPIKSDLAKASTESQAHKTNLDKSNERLAKATTQLETLKSELGKAKERAESAEKEAKGLQEKVGNTERELARLKEDGVQDGAMSVRRGAELSFVIEGGSGTVPPFMTFAFFSSPPTPVQIAAGMEYMTARFNTLSTTKAAVGNDKDNKMSGLEIMQFVGGFAAENANSSLTLSPFHGAGNASGHYGLTGDFFEVGEQKVAFVVLYCAEIGDNTTTHAFDFDGLNLNNGVVEAIRTAKGILVLSCKPDGTLGPFAKHIGE